MSVQHQRDQSGYAATDTIAAVATAVGGAIAIVRISGPEAFELFSKLLAQPKQIATAEPRKLYRTQLVSCLAPGESRLLDDVLFAKFVSPESFTGEDLVEVHLHGGAFVVSSVLEHLLAHGARQALPGEFSFRAVRGGKMNLSQAVAVADLIAASNDAAVSLALESLTSGGTETLPLIQNLARDLRQLSVLGAVGIDFSDQDIDEVSLPQLKKKIPPILKTLEHLHFSYRKGSFIQEGVKVAFVGLPNAGKSSFFNALLGEDRSIVSALPGTTRDVIREKLTLRDGAQGVTLRVSDTAGLRHADQDSVEQIGIQRSLHAAKECDLLVFLIDATTENLNPALEQWRALGSPSAKAVGIITKCDLLSPDTREAAIHSLNGRLIPFGIKTWVCTSSLSLFGIQDAARALAHFCSEWTKRAPGEIVLTRLDQAEAVIAAMQDLRRAESAEEVDLFAADIRQALHSLSPLIGETLSDDILGKIFSEFCIGK